MSEIESIKQAWLKFYNENIKKWTFLTDNFKDAQYDRGYKMQGKPFYSTEDALIFKKLRKGEEEFLQPKGLNSRVELNDKMSKLKESILELENSKRI